MGAGATVRVMTAEEIAARSGGETPFLHGPDRSTLFAEREMRLRQLSRGHAMGEFLAFMAEVAHAQQRALQVFPAVPLPDGDALGRAAAAGVPPLPAADWPRDPAWHAALRQIVAGVRPHAPPAAIEVLDRMDAADADTLEQQADALLNGVMAGLDLAAAPLVAAALQVYWTHMLLSLQAQATAGRHGSNTIGRAEDETVCPCCGSRPTASVTRSAGDVPGQRYLHCSLCSLQWHMVRIKCTNCLDTKGIAYLSLDDVQAIGGGAERAAKAALQAETCDTCGHYLKIMHHERNPLLDPTADDLASLTLDLLVAEGGKLRHGVNLMLLFGEPPPESP